MLTKIIMILLYLLTPIISNCTSPNRNKNLFIPQMHQPITLDLEKSIVSLKTKKKKNVNDIKLLTLYEKINDFIIANQISIVDCIEEVYTNNEQIIFINEGPVDLKNPALVAGIKLKTSHDVKVAMSDQAVSQSFITSNWLMFHANLIKGISEEETRNESESFANFRHKTQNTTEAVFKKEFDKFNQIRNEGIIKFINSSPNRQFAIVFGQMHADFFKKNNIDFPSGKYCKKHIDELERSNPLTKEILREIFFLTSPR